MKKLATALQGSKQMDLTALYLSGTKQQLFVLPALSLAAILTVASSLPAVAEPKPPAPTNTGSTASAETECTVRVILLYDSHCKVTCEEVKPLIKELKEKYAPRVAFAELNTSPDVLKDSKKRAKELGVLSFMADYADYVPIVGVFDSKGKIIKDLQGPKTLEVYEAAIKQALSKSKPAPNK